MKKYLILMFAVLLALPLCFAQQTGFGISKQNECINLIQLCGDCTYNNITSIIYPNKSIEIIDEGMTKRGIEFNYTFCHTSQTGEYFVNGVGDLSGENTAWAYDFEITVHGKEKPSGVVIVLFTLLFLIVLAMLIGLILYTFGHFVQKDFDMKDLIYNLSAYFVIWGIYLLGKEYVGNSFINEFLEWIIAIGAITNVIFPIIIFVISITIWKYMEMGGGS